MQGQTITASSRPRKEVCVETVELNEQTARWESFRWPFADEGKAHAWARKAKRMTKSRRFRSIVVVVRDGEHTSRYTYKSRFPTYSEREQIAARAAALAQGGQANG